VADGEEEIEAGRREGEVGQLTKTERTIPQQSEIFNRLFSSNEELPRVICSFQLLIPGIVLFSQTNEMKKV
jgi:hypothetical protein